jgi:hypothetical protein
MPHTATGSASALLRCDKTIALPIDFCIKKYFKNGAIWLDLVRLSWIKLDFLALFALSGAARWKPSPTSLRLTAKRCDGLEFLAPESNAKSQRAKDAKKGRVAPAFGFPGLGIGWINLSGELRPTEWPRKSAEGIRRRQGSGGQARRNSSF